MTKEIRSGSPVELREDSGTLKVSGYAAVFDSETTIGGFFTEKIARGAFADAVGKDDVRFLINHSGLPLARTKSGTLTLREDERGLYIEADLDANDPDVKSIVPKMKRGDLGEMSFAFRASSETWDDTKEIPQRTINKVDLYDVSIVTYPAYSDTSIALRSLQDYQKDKHSSAPIQARMRMKLALGLATR